jgi:hypothetical protein
MNASIFAAPTLTALLLLAACSEPSSTVVLQSRATTTIRPSQSCTRQDHVEYLPNGALIAVPGDSLFVIGRADLSDCGRYTLTDIVESMLNPAIMQVVIQPTGDVNAPEALLLRQRAATVQAFLSNAGFTRTQPPVLVQPSPGPAGNWGIVLAVAGQQ